MRNNSYIAIFFTFILLFNSCSGYEEQPEISILEETSEEDIYKSLFFMNGPLVDQIPSLQSKKVLFEGFYMDDLSLAEMSRAENLMLEKIKDINPNYLENLKTALLTDSPYQIKDAIIEGSNLLLRSVHEMGFSKILEDEELNNILLSENIDITSYDLSKDEEISRLSNDIASLDPLALNKLQNNDKLASLSVYSNESNKCIVAAAIALAAVFLAVGIMAAVRVVGVVQDAAFVYEYIHVFTEVADGGGGGNAEDGPGGATKTPSDFQNNLLITDLVKL
nr:hypothetical protein [uncultured Allomuricauda sp.]